MKVTRPHFLFVGNGPCVNHGCEAILRTTISVLERAFGKSRFLSCPAAPESDFDPEIVRLPNLFHSTHTFPYGRFTVERVKQKALRSMRKAPYTYEYRFLPFLDRVSVALALGGDNFSLDYGCLHPQLEILTHVRKDGLPTVIWGASIGPFEKSPEDLALAKKELPKASLITVRESISRDYLAGIGVRDNVRLVADPAFVLPKQEVRLPAPLTDALKGECVGVNISPLLGRYVGGECDWVTRAAELLRSLDEVVQRPVILIPHVEYPVPVRPEGRSFINNDRHFMHEALEKLGRSRNRFLEMPAGLNACELKWVISRMAIFVGARTHATIAALSSFVPTISLGYSVKAEGINKDIFGHTDWVLPLGDLSPGNLKERTQALLGSKQAVRQYLQQTIPAYSERSWAGGRFIAGMLLGSHGNDLG